MDFEYNNAFVAQNNINIEDIGNVCIEASNDKGFFFYLIVRTVLGVTWIHTFGPVIPDSQILLKGYSWSSTSLDYKEDKIEKAIKLWLNDKKMLTEAKIIDYEEALELIPDLNELVQSAY